MLLSVSLALCLLATVCNGNNVRWPRVVLLGDSLTEQSFSKDGGWAASIYDRFARKADVLNRGVGGFTAADYLQFLNEAMSGQDAKEIAAVTVMLGTNEALRQLSLTEYYDNLLALVSRLQIQFKIDAGKIILITPPSVDKRKYNIDIEPYANQALKAAASSNVTSLNLFEALRWRFPQQDLFVDGVHFSPIGSKMVYENLWPVVEQKVNKFIRMLGPEL